MLLSKIILLSLFIQFYPTLPYSNSNLLQAGDSSSPPGQSSFPSHTDFISIHCGILLGHSHWPAGQKNGGGAKIIQIDFMTLKYIRIFGPHREKTCLRGV